MDRPARNKKHLTIVDIARRAGVAPMSVSRVINENGYVSKQMREKVLKVVKELNYHPNALARGLKSQRTQVIGILLPDIVNPFSAELVRGIQDVLLPQGYSTAATACSSGLTGIAACSARDRPPFIAALISMI